MRPQIENAAAVGERGAVEAGQRCDRARIDVGDQSRRRVEGEIIARILLVERAGRKLGEKVVGHALALSIDHPASEMREDRKAVLARS